MAQEKITIARPYAEAVFGRAQETGKLDLWSEMLGLLSAVVRSPEVSGLIANPKLSREQLQALMLEVGGGRLNDEGQNLVKLLAHNDRLSLLPEIAQMYEQLKREHQGVLQVQVRSAYAVSKAQENVLAEALKKRLGRDIEISAEKDASLIGGIVIRAGDLVIDGSVRGQLRKLTNELGI
jgi:F-type H+-transporting ATPase subunit delta